MPVVILALQGVRTLNEAQFRQHAPWLYNLLCNLVKCRDPRVRGLVSDVMRRQLVALLPLDAGGAAAASAEAPATDE